MEAVVWAKLRRRMAEVMVGVGPCGGSEEVTSPGIDDDEKKP